MPQRVFITGFGIISAIGNGADETLASLKAKQSGIGRLELFESALSNIPVGEIKKSALELSELAGIEHNAHNSRAFLLGLIAAKAAMQMAGYQKGYNRMGMIGSTTVAGQDLLDTYYTQMLDGTLVDAEMHRAFTGADATEKIAITLGIKHNVTTISTACSSSANAIMNGVRMIRCGLADTMLVGGMDSLARFSLNGFNALEILSPTGCKPFDQDRNGITPGEGAAFLVLESEAKTAGKQKYGEIRGFANFNEAYHQTLVNPDGVYAEAAMRKAIETAGLQPADIDYLNAHGTGTEANDLVESKAIKSVFGDHLPHISSTKGFTGHTFAAAGAIECVFSLLAINNNLALPNVGFSTPIDETGIVPVTEPTSMKINNIISNSFGFGGNDTSLVISKAE